jgi:putative Ca2+/H+ antiporter (TMEM165/GDT1 family)
VKILPRAISIASIVLGVFLVSRTFVLENRYASVMPHGRDVMAGRTTPVLVGHETHVYVTEAEAKTLDAAQTYFTFGWAFVILGVLLAAASRERRPPFMPSTDSDSPWTERR